MAGGGNRDACPRCFAPQAVIGARLAHEAPLPPRRREHEVQTHAHGAARRDDVGAQLLAVPLAEKRARHFHLSLGLRLGRTGGLGGPAGSLCSESPHGSAGTLGAEGRARRVPSTLPNTRVCAPPSATPSTWRSCCKSDLTRRGYVCRSSCPCPHWPCSDDPHVYRSPQSGWRRSTGLARAVRARMRWRRAGRCALVTAALWLAPAATRATCTPRPSMPESRGTLHGTALSKRS